MFKNLWFLSSPREINPRCPVIFDANKKYIVVFPSKACLCNTEYVSYQVDRVFIWDLDETIILFHSLLTGTFANK